MDTAADERVREYYRALDEHDYGVFEELLAPEFVHERPDRTLDGRDRFVRFMREERPNRETSHRIEGIFHAHGDGDKNATADRDSTASSEDVAVDRDSTVGGDPAEAGTGGMAVRGRLLDSDGEFLFEFVDVFTFVDGRIDRIDTFSRSA